LKIARLAIGEGRPILRLLPLGLSGSRGDFGKSSLRREIKR
jgi:hypothetical protein